MAAELPRLSGEWDSYYRYPSSGRGDDALWGRHVLEAMQEGNLLQLQSAPDSKSVVTMELQLDEAGQRAAGTWREETEPDGYYHGAVYEGTIEFEVGSDGQRLNGRWQGAGREGEMNSDVWDLVRPGVERTEDKA
jgi:hypothetical protein